MGGILNRSASFRSSTEARSTFCLTFYSVILPPTHAFLFRSFLLFLQETQNLPIGRSKEKKNETIMYLQTVRTAAYKYICPASGINSFVAIASARDSSVTNRWNILEFFSFSFFHWLSTNNFSFYDRSRNRSNDTSTFVD